MPQDAAQRFHHPNHQKDAAGDLDFFIQRFVAAREQRLDQILAQHRHAGTLLDVQFGNVPAARDVTRDSEFMIRRHADQDGGVALLIRVANRLVDLAIEGRDAHD